VHRIDVQQGNYVTQDSVAKLKKGMTKAEVRQLLGTPLLSDVFHANRWDYYFSHEKGRKTEKTSRLSLFFVDEKLVQVTGDGREASPVAASPPAR
jgi:outer membrane protein assembly factor BamE